MAAAISWTDHVSTVPLANVEMLTGGGTTVHTNDPAYPTRNMFDNDPSLYAQFNVTRDATVGANTTLRVRWSLVANSLTVRTISALNVRLPAGATNILARAINFSAGSIEAASAFVAADLVPRPNFTDRYNLHWLLTQDRSSAGIEFVMQLPASAVHTYGIGRLRASPAIVLPSGTDRDWSIGYVDQSEVERARGGAISGQALPVRQKISAPIRRQLYDLVMGTAGSASTLNFRRMFLECGLRTPLVFMQRTSSQHGIQTHSIFGTLTQLKDTKHERANKFALELEAEEIT